MAGALLAHESNLQSAILFGSVARGEHTPWSDVDVGVLLPTPIDIGYQVELASRLAEIFRTRS